MLPFRGRYRRRLQLKANSVMRNEIIQQSQTTASPIALTPHADALSRLEPVAVPLGRIASTLRRHIWVLMVVFAIGVGGTVRGG